MPALSNIDPRNSHTEFFNKNGYGPGEGVGLWPMVRILTIFPVSDSSGPVHHLSLGCNIDCFNGDE